MAARSLQFFDDFRGRNILSVKGDALKITGIHIVNQQLLLIHRRRHLHISHQLSLRIQDKSLSRLRGSCVDGDGFDVFLIDSGIIFRMFIIPDLPNTVRVLRIVNTVITIVGCRVILRRSQIPLCFGSRYNRRIIHHRLQNIRILGREPLLKGFFVQEGTDIDAVKVSVSILLFSQNIKENDIGRPGTAQRLVQEAMPIGVAHIAHIVLCEGFMDFGGDIVAKARLHDGDGFIVQRHIRYTHCLIVARIRIPRILHLLLKIRLLQSPGMSFRNPVCFILRTKVRNPFGIFRGV